MKMKYDLYLNFIHELIITNQLREETHIQKFSNGKLVEDGDCITKRVSVKKVVIEYTLDEQTSLLIEDIPVNFFLAYTILIGENCPLVSFHDSKRGKTLICHQSLLPTLNIKKEDTTPYDATDLRDKELISSFETPSIIQSLRKYIKEAKELDLTRIHITKGPSLELFLPTIHAHHFSLAQLIEVPMKSLIQDNYVRDTNINVYDINHQLEELQPFLTHEESKEWDIEKKTGNRIYKDLSVDYMVYFNRGYLKDRLDKIPLEQKKKNELNAQFESLKKLQLTSSKGEVPFPVWKSYQRQSFIKIKDTQEFQERTGRPFRLEKKFLNEIFISEKNSQKALYKDRYLKGDIQTILEEAFSENITLTYRSPHELAIKCMVRPDINNFLEKSTNSLDHYKEIESHLDRAISLFIEQLVKANRIEEPQDPKPLYYEFYDQTCQELLDILTLYNNVKVSNEEVIKSLLLHSQYIHKTLSYTMFNPQNSVIIAKALYLIASLYGIYNSFYANKKKYHIKDFFKEYDLHKVEKIKVKESKLQFYHDVISCYELKKSGRKPHIVLHKTFEPELFLSPVKVLESKPSMVRTSLKRNLIKKLYPYSYEKIIKASEENQHVREIEIGNRLIILKKEYFSTHRIYIGFKTVSENDYFSLLLPLSDQKP